jgi:hypothetical protein
VVVYVLAPAPVCPLALAPGSVTGTTDPRVADGEEAEDEDVTVMVPTVTIGLYMPSVSARALQNELQKIEETYTVCCAVAKTLSRAVRSIMTFMAAVN